MGVIKHLSLSIICNTDEDGYKNVMELKIYVNCFLSFSYKKNGVFCEES
jgi:hypothetical protein